MPELTIPLLLIALSFLSLFLLSWGISFYLRDYAQHRKLTEKIHWEREGKSGFSIEGLSLNNKGGENRPFLRYLSFLGKLINSEESTDHSRMRINFLKAGLYRANVPSIFWGTKAFLGIGLSVSFILLRVTIFRLFDPGLSLIICLVAALVGFYLPDLWLSLRIAGRKDKIAKGLPDALDLFVVCIEAGMGLDSAINRVAQEIKLTCSELSDEFRLYNLELKAGKSRQDALKNLALRTDHEDINSLVTLIIQADKFGTGVTQALRVYSDSFRTKRYLRAEEVAAKMPLKLVVVLIFFIFPALFVVVLGPPIIRAIDLLYN
jgi:tight adherence protein C